MNGTLERPVEVKSARGKTFSHTAEINPFFEGVFRRYHSINNPIEHIDITGLVNGDFPPAPPGFNSNWEIGQWPGTGRWWVRDPINNTRYTIHPEDNAHWRHWDEDQTGQWPPNSKKKWPGQKKKCKADQSETDPNGDSPPWIPPSSCAYFGICFDMPYIPIEIPVNGMVPMPLAGQ